MSQKFLLPNGDVSTADTEDARQALLAAGAAPASDAELHVNDLKKQYSEWYYAPEAFALKAAQSALPGATSAVLGGLDALNPDMAETSAEAIKGITEAHPMAGTLGFLAGAAATGGAGMAVKGLAKTAALGGGFAAAGLADDTTIDTLALAHVQSPEGGEKVFAQLGVAALIGAPLAVFGLKVTNWVANKGIGRVGAALEEKGEQVLANKTIPKPAQEKLAQSGVLDDAKAYLAENKLVTKSPGEIKSFLRDRAQVTKSVIDEARAATQSERLDMPTQLQFAQQMRQQLAGTPVLPKAMKAFDEPWGLEQLHNLRMSVDKATNYAEPTSQYTQRLMTARETVDQQIKDLFSGWASNPHMAEQATRWQAANDEFALLMKLGGALKTKGSGGPGLLAALANGLDKAGNYAIGGSVVTAGASAVPGLAMKGAAAGIRATQGKAGGQALVGIGKALQSFDEQVVQVVADGMSKGGGSASGAGQTVAKLTNYNELLALVNLAAQRPTEVIPRMAQHLEEQGVPGELADAAVPQGLKTIQYLAGEAQALQNPFLGQTVAPTQWHAPAAAKAEFADKVNAVNNPLWALANPTPTRIAALKAAYPNMMTRVQTMVAEHSATRPDMTPAARRWAAHVTGLAASPMAMPRLRAALAFGDQQLAQARQQQAQGGQKGGGSSMIGNSRLDRMTE